MDYQTSQSRAIPPHARRPGRPHSPRNDFSTDPQDPIPVLISVWSKCIAPQRWMSHPEGVKPSRSG